MHSFKVAVLVVAVCLIAPAGISQESVIGNDAVDKIVAQEQAEMQLLRQYSPLVETYIQYLRADRQSVAIPGGDKYFLGRAKLTDGVELQPLQFDNGLKNKWIEGWREFLSMAPVPGGFLQMIYLDNAGFDRQHYKFDYVGKEFLGEVRCLVFDVHPLRSTEKGRFVGRIWAEDLDYHIVRFNGSYGEYALLSKYFNFDSWRTNIGANLWLPSFVYTEQGNLHDPQTVQLAFKPFRAQTRLWGYSLGHSHEEQELVKVLVEAQTPVKDLTDSSKDYSPFESERAWSHQAEANVTDQLERHGLVAPRGEVDRVLELVVNNLEVTNNLEILPEVQCRVLMTSTLESFSIGHTIVLSRGLLDVLPDEASLAAILAHELSHILLAHGMNTEFAFFNNTLFSERETFGHFNFARSRTEEQAAQQKTRELLAKSPYQDKTETAQLFFEALKTRSKDIPNLVSPHLGDRVVRARTTTATAAPEKPDAKQVSSVIAALPLGGRIRVDPWNDELKLAKSKPIDARAEAEKMPFQITPLVLYLTRQADQDTGTQVPGGVALKLDTTAKP